MEYISVLPGRVRFKAREIYHNAKLAKDIEKYIISFYGVKSGSVTVNTGSVLVVYNIRKTNPEVLKENIENALSATVITEHSNPDVLDSYFDVIEKKKRAGRKLLIWSLFYLLIKMKGFHYGKFSVSRNLNVLKAASAVTIIGGYPLLKKLYKKVTKNVPANTDLLLELSALSFTILRESSKGILVLVLKALDDYIKFYAEAENRKALLDSYGKNFRMAWIKSPEGNDVLVSIDTLKLGDYIYVNSGEMVPAGGLIEEGNALVNNLYSTGRTLVTHVGKGAEIEEGIVLISGYLKIKVTKLPDITEKKDVPAENLSFYNRVNEYQNKITYFSLGMAALSYIYTGNILNALSVMLVLSPKATSAALKSGMNSYVYLLRKNNIYLRNLNTLENIRNVDKIIFDKTGTLTYGQMRLIPVASFESASAYNDIRNIFSDWTESDDSCVEAAEHIPYKGVKATTYHNNDIIIGNEELMKENNIDYSLGLKRCQSYHNDLLLPVFVAINKKLAGIVVLNDEFRKDSIELIDRLNYYGINDISLLTGDSDQKAQHIASLLGIKKVYSERNCLEKAQIVEREAKYGIVMMVGDGLNDIMAMRAAHVSVSYAGNSSDKVKLNSDCVIYDDNMPKLADLILLSQKSYRSVSRTMLFSNVYNIVFSILAFSGGVDIFAAKSLNTLNSLSVLLLNKRILLIHPGKIPDEINQNYE